MSWINGLRWLGAALVLAVCAGCANHNSVNGNNSAKFDTPQYCASQIASLRTTIKNDEKLTHVHDGSAWDKSKGLLKNAQHAYAQQQYRACADDVRQARFYLHRGEGYARWQKSFGN